MTDAFLPLLEKSAAPVIAETDQQVIEGSGANGEVLGIQLAPGITTIAASAIDIQHVYGAIANAVQTIHSTRFLPPEVIVMHPRRWGWFLSLLDASQRPLFLGTANAPMNVAGVLTDVASQQIVGSLLGVHRGPLPAERRRDHGFVRTGVVRAIPPCYLLCVGGGFRWHGSRWGPPISTGDRTPSTTTSLV
jgi:hypothetical protein